MKKLIVATMIGVMLVMTTACGENKTPDFTLSDPNEEIIVENIKVEEIQVEEIRWENNVTSWDDVEETW